MVTVKNPMIDLSKIAMIFIRKYKPEFLKLGTKIIYQLSKVSIILNVKPSWKWYLKRKKEILHYVGP